MFRLAHISDIHLGPLPRLSARELASKRITGYINWHRNRGKRLFGNILESLLDDIRAADPDHLAVTGDLVNLATKAEIMAATQWLVETGDPQDVSVVPGNHDAYVPGAFEALSHAWRPYMLGDDEALSTSGDNLFPYCRVRGNVALIGVSTASATPPFSANGIFGRRQALALRQHLVEAENEGLFRVVMIHHPPVRGAAKTYKRMLGIRRFGAVMRSAGAELVLHGHTHLDTLYRLPGKDADVPVVGVPSASEALGGHRPASGYNLFTISGAPGAWSCRLDRYGLDADSRSFEVFRSEEL
ncbi:metallophosphoesterase family protein [Hoeflea prorocentri]|uniref:Metallophosphoesterase n=1 Tax=Hoeflea prorocentri TaxID=1922333 RepID=A0A9X3UIY6_9HYPH|nr:metallophosphoesterase [Hoeflea prorocentri]MCY6379521.1 metallophosphoesterase [Hoeflea prorocentri]MDA5397321.1 metallophosphoesterase [Hoeflea prorocentri]